MFRKPSKKKKISKIRKRDEDEDDDEEEDQSVQDKIRSTQKKQKILSSLPLVTGNPSRKSSNKKANDAQNSENVTGEMSVMEKKQHQLMQEYIEEQMNKDKPSGNDNANSDSVKRDENTKRSAVTSEEELYQELAKEVYSKRQHENKQVQEERGAVLVGGTGLAEVILPSSLSGNNKADQHQSKNRVYRRDASSSAVPASSSMSHATLTTSAIPHFRNFQQHKTNNNRANQQSEEKDATTTTKEGDSASESATTASTGDGDRVGFNAYRGKPTEKKPIVKKQRDDSVFSDFVKHQREKMMNRR